jgi:hypothetical protein
MTIPRRSHSPPFGKQTPPSGWWVVRFASKRVANMFTSRTIDKRDTPDLEMGIELQAVNQDPDNHNDRGSISRPERDLDSHEGYLQKLQRRKVGHFTSHEQTVNSQLYQIF